MHNKQININKIIKTDEYIYLKTSWECCGLFVPAEGEREKVEDCLLCHIYTPLTPKEI